LGGIPYLFLWANRTGFSPFFLFAYDAHLKNDAVLRIAALPVAVWSRLSGLRGCVPACLSRNGSGLVIFCRICVALE